MISLSISYFILNKSWNNLLKDLKMIIIFLLIIALQVEKLLKFPTNLTLFQ
jgi:hypothetical protein